MFMYYSVKMSKANTTCLYHRISAICGIFVCNVHVVFDKQYVLYPLLHALLVTQTA